jgi:hypothetical protein
MVKQGSRVVQVKTEGWVFVIKKKTAKERTISRQPNKSGGNKKKSLSLQNRRIFIEKLPSDSFSPY